MTGIFGMLEKYKTFTTRFWVSAMEQSNDCRSQGYARDINLLKVNVAVSQCNHIVTSSNKLYAIQIPEKRLLKKCIEHFKLSTGPVKSLGNGHGTKQLSLVSYIITNIALSKVSSDGSAQESDTHENTRAIPKVYAVAFHCCERLKKNLKLPMRMTAFHLCLNQYRNGQDCWETCLNHHNMTHRKATKQYKTKIS